VDGEPVSDETESLRRRVAELEREVERLEAANRELRRANVRLAEGRVTKIDSAAVTALQRERPGPGVATRLRGGLRARMRGLALRILR
jgi:hypothetical protein